MRAESDAKQELVGADGAERRHHKDTWTRFLTVEEPQLRGVRFTFSSMLPRC